MTKSPITLQELRRRIYVKAKAEKSWRFLRQGFGWKRWSRRWMYATVGLFTITLREKCAGARSAGKPHAACDVAGAGNGLTVRLVRHSHRKRGEADRPRLRSTAPAVVFYIESRRFLIRDSPRPATTYEQKTGGADGVKGA